MKLKFTITLLLIGLLSFGQTQTRDVLYLKNGSVIKGSITEMNPTTGIKIKTADGSLFVYKMSEILKTEKEEFVGQKSNQETTSAVNNKVLSDYFSNYIANNRPALKFIGASKVNGVKREIYGQKIYEVEYEVVLETVQDIYVNASQFGSAFSNRFVDDFSYSKAQSGGYEAALAGSKKKIAKGQRITANGSLNFEETENGWRGKKFKNKNFKTVSSTYLPPALAKQNAEDQAKLAAKLKVDLDFKNPDLKQPIEFESKYYKTENVPLFDFGNSRYTIATTKSYKGRNDNAASVYNAFYDALKSTKRIQESANEDFSSSKNQAKYTFVISSIKYAFKDTGYQCQISVIGKASGIYESPEYLPFSYPIKLPSKSNSFKKNMSKAAAFESALQTFKSAVRGMVFKYEPVQLKFKKIITNKRGKVDQVIFEKPAQFMSLRKIKIIFLRSEDLTIENEKFKLLGKIADLTYKGKISGNEIICNVSGSKNKKAIANFIDTQEKLIGITSF